MVILVAISCKSQATAIEMGLGIGPEKLLSDNIFPNGSLNNFLFSTEE